MNIRTFKKNHKLKHLKEWVFKYGNQDVNDGINRVHALQQFEKLTTSQLAAVLWITSRAFGGGYQSCSQDNRKAGVK